MSRKPGRHGDGPIVKAPRMAHGFNREHHVPAAVAWRPDSEETVCHTQDHDTVNGKGNCYSKKIPEFTSGSLADPVHGGQIETGKLAEAPGANPPITRADPVAGGRSWRFTQSSHGPIRFPDRVVIGSMRIIHEPHSKNGGGIRRRPWVRGTIAARGVGGRCGVFPVRNSVKPAASRE